MPLTVRTIPWRKWMRSLRIGYRLGGLALYVALAICHFSAGSYFRILIGEPIQPEDVRFFLVTNAFHAVTVQIAWAYMRAGHRSWWHIGLTLLASMFITFLINDASLNDLYILRDIPLQRRLAVLFFEYARENLLVHGGWYAGMLIHAQRQSVMRSKQDGLALEKSLAQARLAALQNQTNPHFLFNALNTVNALIGANRSDEASTAVIKLGALLRNSLKGDVSPMVTAREDVENAQIYLDLEHLRFGERLDLRWDVDPDCLDRVVPSFTLQPLLENIVKHAVACTENRIEARIEIASGPHGNLNIIVSNSIAGSPVANPADRTGLGLANLGERLRLLCGERATLVAGPDGETRYRVEISIPRQPLTE
jgi:histidine kinase